MAFGVTTDGFVIKPLATIQSEIEDQERADIDPGLDLDARSTLGQLNGIFSGALAELWELGQATYSAAYPDSSSAASLDNVSSITSTTRDPTTKTLVEGVEVMLNPNTALPAGSVANIQNQPNARFVSLTLVPADTGGGVFTVDFEAETAGATTVDINTLTEIAEPVNGWTAVDNPAAGITGDATQTDAQLRIKRLVELEGGGSTNINSIRANLVALDGVVDANVTENDTDVTVGSLAPHSILAVLRGGDSEEVAQSIFDTKAAGIATNGDESEVILDTQGVGHTIRFSFATQLNYFLTATVTTNALTFDTVNGEDDIDTAVAVYINSLGVGGDVIVGQVKCAILSVTGTIDVTVFFHGFSAAPTGTTNLTVADTEFVTSDVANIIITIP